MLDSSTNEHYNVTHNGPYDPYYLTITGMSKVHFGVYYCCLQTGCFNNITEDQCQRFDLLEAGGRGGEGSHYLLPGGGGWGRSENFGCVAIKKFPSLKTP